MSTDKSFGERFDSLSEAAIDASSIIYMLKAGLLGLLGSTITLKSVPEVLVETGWPELPVTPIPADRPEVMTNDERLLHFALDHSLSLISEDRSLLRVAGAAGLDYYNSLMMLAFLRHRGRIDAVWYVEAKARLLEISRYGPEVLRRYEDICRELGIEG